MALVVRLRVTELTERPTRLPADATLVLIEGNIRYRQPVVGEIIARCQIPQEKMDAFLARLHKRGRARLNASVQVPDTLQPAAEYHGTLFAQLNQG
jgi:thioesterase domain-containing protein